MSLDIEPDRPLEANSCTQEDGAWPRRECQSVREGKEETAIAIATTETRATGGRWKLSTGNIHPTLGSVPSFYLILRSSTIHPE